MVDVDNPMEISVTTLKLPEPIAEYFDADKHGGEAVARCFTKAAVVKDEGETYEGRSAIAGWKSAASERFSYTSEPIELRREDGLYVVRSRVTGTFPGSPVGLNLSFRLEAGKISSLEITP